MGLGVVEVVIAEVQTHLIGDVPHGSEGELCRRVLVDALSITEFIDGRYLAGFVDGGLVLHTYLSLGLVLHGEVERTNAIVNAYDGGYAHTRLVAEQVDALRVLLQGVEALLGALELCEFGDELSRCLHAGCLILGDACVDLTDASVDGGGGCLKETAKVDIATSGVHHDVVNLGLIGGCAIEQTQTAIDGEVRRDLIGSSKLEAEVVVAALHVAVHVVACGSKRLQLSGDAAHYTLEGTQTVGKLTGSATARD